MSYSIRRAKRMAAERARRANRINWFMCRHFPYAPVVSYSGVNVAAKNLSDAIDAEAPEVFYAGKWISGGRIHISSRQDMEQAIRDGNAVVLSLHTTP